jgi:phosphatidate phosphatase APP1
VSEERWAATLTRLLARAERGVDAAKYGVGRRLGGRRKTVIVPYRGYGRRDRLWLKGRVLREPDIPAAVAGDPLWRNLLATWRRFESDEVPGARVRVEAAGASVEVEADEEGYFNAWLPLDEPLPTSIQAVPVVLRLLSPATREPVVCSGEVVVPPTTARLAVVSDIDDTVVPTDARRLLRMARNTFTRNAHSRAPFPGVAAFYRALRSGRGAEGNPFLYVSSGPWNLYDLLLEAFRLHGLPAGSLHLRDWGLSAGQLLPHRHQEHKLGAIRQAMELWSDLPFLLIGDSGQEDPEIYHQLASEASGRILAVYIRNVSRDLARPAAIGELATELAASGGTLLLAPTAWELAEHARERGWIAADALPAVAAALGRDGAPPKPTAAATASAKRDDAEQARAAPPTAESRATADRVESALQEGEGTLPPAVKVEPGGAAGPQVQAVEPTSPASPTSTAAR